MEKMLVLVSLAAAGPQYGRDGRYTPEVESIGCYSCMSPALDGDIESLRPMLGLPLAFTQACDDDSFRFQNLRGKLCSHSCVSLRFHRRSVQNRSEHLHMRGCIGELGEANRSALAALVEVGHRSGRPCAHTTLHALFPPRGEEGHPRMEDQVELCVCRERDWCNSPELSVRQTSGAQTPVPPGQNLWWPVLIVGLILLILISKPIGIAIAVSVQKLDELAHEEW